MPHDKILIVNDTRYLDEILIALTRNISMAVGESNAHKLMLMIESFQIELFIND